MMLPGFVALRGAPENQGRLILVRIDEIDWIEAADNYVCLHRGSETHILRETLANIESRLGESGFVRIHRSAIVNVDRIRELQPWTRGDYRIVLADGTELMLRKTWRGKLESRLLTGLRT